jgi:hypothetical protein
MNRQCIVGLNYQISQRFILIPKPVLPRGSYLNRSKIVLELTEVVEVLVRISISLWFFSFNLTAQKADCQKESDARKKFTGTIAIAIVRINF